YQFLMSCMDVHPCPPLPSLCDNYIHLFRPAASTCTTRLSSSSKSSPPGSTLISSPGNLISSAPSSLVSPATIPSLASPPLPSANLISLRGLHFSSQEHFLAKSLIDHFHPRSGDLRGIERWGQQIWESLS
ncbi:hypothetical protein AMTR_s00025p00038770, partial [Amborella trichopoda]